MRTKHNRTTSHNRTVPMVFISRVVSDVFCGLLSQFALFQLSFVFILMLFAVAAFVARGVALFCPVAVLFCSQFCFACVCCVRLCLQLWLCFSVAVLIFQLHVPLSRVSLVHLRVWFHLLKKPRCNYAMFP